MQFVRHDEVRSCCCWVVSSPCRFCFCSEILFEQLLVILAVAFVVSVVSVDVTVTFVVSVVCIDVIATFIVSVVSVDVTIVVCL